MFKTTKTRRNERQGRQRGDPFPPVGKFTPLPGDKEHPIVITADGEENTLPSQGTLMSLLRAVDTSNIEPENCEGGTTTAAGEIAKKRGAADEAEELPPSKFSEGGNGERVAAGDTAASSPLLGWGQEATNPMVQEMMENYFRYPFSTLPQQFGDVVASRVATAVENSLAAPIHLQRSVSPHPDSPLRQPYIADILANADPYHFVSREEKYLHERDILITRLLNERKAAELGVRLLSNQKARIEELEQGVERFISARDQQLRHFEDLKTEVGSLSAKFVDQEKRTSLAWIYLAERAEEVKALKNVRKMGPKEFEAEKMKFAEEKGRFAGEKEEFDQKKARFDEEEKIADDKKLLKVNEGLVESEVDYRRGFYELKIRVTALNNVLDVAEEERLERFDEARKLQEERAKAEDEASEAKANVAKADNENRALMAKIAALESKLSAKENSIRRAFTD